MKIDRFIFSFLYLNVGLLCSMGRRSYTSDELRALRGNGSQEDEAALIDSIYWQAVANEIPEETSREVIWRRWYAFHFAPWLLPTLQDSDSEDEDVLFCDEEDVL